jgi:transcriptional regulator of acetoin/glycerol metabolism
MYELVWHHSGFQIVRCETPSTEKVLKKAHAGSPALAASSKRPDSAIWREFVRTGTADLSALNAPIRDSWIRCRQIGVDPAHGKCRDIRGEKELSAQFSLLRDIISGSLDQICSPFADSGLLVTVSDSNGYLIRMYGDHKTLLAADQLNFGPGANWSEASVGTNAIGTALAAGQPLQVAASEHFCQDHQRWVCTAAPIYDIYGEIIGCIDVSGPTDSDHRWALDFVLNGARAIESRLFRQQAIDLQQQPGPLTTSVFNADAGLLFLDRQGIITAANPAAADLLKMSPERLAGVRADAFFNVGHSLDTLKRSFRTYTHTGLDVRRPKNQAFDIRIYPLVSHNQSLAGMLIVIHGRPQTRDPVASSGDPDPFKTIIGDSISIKNAIGMARRAARTDSTVLITGESGTGKELLARAIHEAGCRPEGPFVAINCGALPSELIQSELFGYEEGAFTGARRGGSAGKFEQASGGTLLLDEIAEMPLAMQVNLLRVLEENQVTRVGGTKPRPVDVRIIAATNRQLDALAGLGTFRHDLFYRLNVVRIQLPPLRQRGSDVDLLADRFIRELSRKLNRRVARVAPGFYSALRAYPWPGNVRELRHAIEGAIALMDADTLSPDGLPDYVQPAGAATAAMPGSSSQAFNLKAVEEETITSAYRHFYGNISKMARALGIGRNTLYAKLKKFNLM